MTRPVPHTPGPFACGRREFGTGCVTWAVTSGTGLITELLELGECPRGRTRADALLFAASPTMLETIDGGWHELLAEASRLRAGGHHAAADRLVILSDRFADAARLARHGPPSWQLAGTDVVPVASLAPITSEGGAA